MSENKKTQTGTKKWLLLALSFLIPFVIGGSAAWLMEIAGDDHPGQGSTDQEYEAHERQVNEMAKQEFWHCGIPSGFVGFGAAVGIFWLRNRRRKTSQL